jgi:hypothetical protein
MVVCSRFADANLHSVCDARKNIDLIRRAALKTGAVEWKKIAQEGDQTLMGESKRRVNES